MTESSAGGAPASFSYAGHGPNAAVGIALCHGFTGSPLSIMPWAEFLAAQGFAVSVPLLPGHGTDWKDLARTGWKDWYGAFERSYLDLRAATDSCFVAGLSMGGAMALQLASRHSVDGVAVVNPALSFYDRRIYVVGLLKYFMQTTTPVEEQNPTAQPTYDGDYARTPLEAIYQLRQLLRSTARRLPMVTAPLIVFKSARDDVVPPNSLERIRRRVGSASLSVVELPGSGHVATLDVDAATVFAESAAFFLANVTSTAR
jgi:carboxylesterase